MKLLHWHRHILLNQRCWFYNPPQHYDGGFSRPSPSGKNNREKLEPHIQKWNEKRETLCDRKPKDCIVNIHSFFNIIHQLNPSWATEKSLDLKRIKGEFNRSCLALCSGCEQRTEKS